MSTLNPTNTSGKKSAPKPPKASASKRQKTVASSGAIVADSTQKQNRASAYFSRPEGIFRRKGTDGGNNIVNEQLTNFVVDSVRSIFEDDGVERNRFFEIEASIEGHHGRGRVSAAEFQKMQWPQQMLGFNAVVFPRMTEHARTA